MIIRILSCAEQELADAVDYYNKQCPGLGFEFAAEVKSTLSRIAAFPNAWPLFSRRTRRSLVHRFPYGVLYQVRTEEILVTAIMHIKLDPEKWQKRVAKT